MKKLDYRNIFVASVLILAAALSFLLGTAVFSRPEIYRETVVSIDEKAATVLKLSAASTIASAGISMIPDDTATPIAAKLADFTEYFMLILCVLYTEKYLLTVIGTVAFEILIPAALLIYIWSRFRGASQFSKFAMKIGAFSLALMLVIPASNQVSNMIYDTYQNSIDSTISSAEAFGKASGAEESGSIWSKAADLTNRAGRVMNNYVESLAVLLVTSCGIPVLVLLFFAWGIKLLTGLDLSLPAPRRERLEKGDA